MLRLIPPEQRNKCRCSICGETRSVKYLADISDGFEPVGEKPLCNKCAAYLLDTGIKQSNPNKINN